MSNKYKTLNRYKIICIDVITFVANIFRKIVNKDAQCYYIAQIQL